MKKLFFISIISVLTAIFGVPQSVSAKDKKVTYLGHYFRGAVDNNKVPAGNGVMNVNGLVIRGIFDNHSATDAEVYIVAALGWASSTFLGNVTFDESDNITLKAGGVISTTFYYSKGNKDNHEYLENRDPGIIADTLKEDRVVNSGNFEKKSITFYYALDKNKDNGGIRRIDMDELNPPTFMVPYTVGKTKINRYKGESVDMDVFVNYADHKGENIKISDYKDDLGRTWNFRRTGDQDNIAVKYPDGSKFSCSTQGYQMKSSQWECHLSEGKVVTFEDDGKTTIFDLGKIQIKTKGSNGNRLFADAKKTGKFFLDSYTIHISSNSIDLTKSTNAEIEKLLAQEVKPFVGSTQIYVCDNSGSEIGEYYKGEYQSKKQKEAAKAKRDAANKAALNKSIVNFKKKYGFDPSVDNVRYIVKVGRNVLGVIDARNEWLSEYGNKLDQISIKLVRDQGASKCYEFYSNWGAFYQGFFWTRNNVITSIHWGR